MSQVIRYSMGVTCVLYVLLGTLGCLAYGTDTQPNVIQSLPVCSHRVCVCVCVSYVMAIGCAARDAARDDSEGCSGDNGVTGCTTSSASILCQLARRRTTHAGVHACCVHAQVFVCRDAILALVEGPAKRVPFRNVAADVADSTTNGLDTVSSVGSITADVDVSFARERYPLLGEPSRAAGA